MAWLSKHWAGAVAIFLTALYIYLQLLQWKRHGDDLMLTAANIVVTVMLWAVLLIAIGRYWRDSRKAAEFQKLISEIRQDHATEITRLYTQHEADENRSHQSRDEALTRQHAAEEKSLAENLEKTDVQKELAREVAALAALEQPDTSLRGRVLTLAHDVLAFLKERDCEAEWETSPPSNPPASLLPLPALQSLSVADYAKITGAKAPETNAAQKTMDGIKYGFERQFKMRLSTLLLELEEHGISDYELERNANGGVLGSYYCANIRTIAERLLIVWSRMQS